MTWEGIGHAGFEEHLKWEMSRDKDGERRAGRHAWTEAFVHTAVDQWLIRIESDIFLNAQASNLPS